MDNPTSRRHFLRTTCTSATLLAMGWSLSGCDSSPAEEDPDPIPGSGVSIDGNTITLDLRATDTSQLAAAGGFLLIKSARTLAVNVDGNAIRAFTSVCTHQGCDVEGFQNSRLTCFCHGSQYNTSGEVVAGPAPSPLKEFAVTRSENTVTINKT